MSKESNDCAIKVANISRLVGEADIKEMFGILGEIVEFKFPLKTELPARDCKIVYKDSSSCLTALHLTGTELGDRMLIVTAYDSSLTLDPTVTQDPIDQTVVSQFASILAPFDASKLDEIGRTVFVSDLDPSADEAEIVKHFELCGKVAYLRVAGDKTHNGKFAFIEFEEMRGAKKALDLNNTLFMDRPIRVKQSKNALCKGRKINTSQADRTLRQASDEQLKLAKTYGLDEPRGRSRSRERVKKDRSPRTRLRSRSRSVSSRRSRHRRPVSRSPRRRSRDREHRSSRSGRDRSKDRSEKDREREKEREKRKEKEKDTDKLSIKETDKPKEKDALPEKERERSSHHDKEREKDRSRDKERDRTREKERERTKDRPREDRPRDRERRERRRSRTPTRRR